MLLAEKSILNKMYEMYRGNKGELAKRIGIGRTTLYRKLKEFDIE
ncbi:helix-turn-helix domain-containing protein [Siminovitchia sp. 179-K 8D1 HS]